VQSYGLARRNRNATRTPGWLVEGIADYIRWFLYEPETYGAEITARNIGRARYDASYRVSGNFLNWVTEEYDKDIVRKLNAAVREGMYSEDLWKKHTERTVQQLGDEWKKDLEKQIAAEAAAAGRRGSGRVEAHFRRQDLQGVAEFQEQQGAKRLADKERDARLRGSAQRRRSVHR